MQDIHLIGSGGGDGRLFGGRGGDRRWRSNHHRDGSGPPALKCPRCESVNTKFCYYNNYNLSQPRYFCKSCRRYWTKGGVLRNVPVGGGCRKKKRSKTKSGYRNRNSNSGVRKSSDSQNSSSDSSSLTATTTAANTSATATTTAPVTVPEVFSGMNSTNSAPTSFHFHEAPNPSFDPPLPDHHSSDGNRIFREIDTLTSLITSLVPLPPEFNTSGGISPFRLHHTGRIVEESNTDQQQWINTPPAEFSGLPDTITGGGFGSEDWNNCTDQALFDLTGTVDQSYWNHTQWDDHEHPRQHHAHHDDDDHVDDQNDLR